MSLTAQELRQAKKLQHMKGANLDNFLPVDLMLQFEEACGYTIHGSSKLTPANKRLSNTDMLRTMNWLIIKYNKTAKQENQQRALFNIELSRRLTRNEISPEEAATLKVNLLKLAHAPQTH